MHLQICECVAGGRSPKKRSVYTVRATLVADEKQLLYLAEISNPGFTFAEGVMEPPFPASYFRPIVERKTDISIFTAMLNPSDKRVEA